MKSLFLGASLLLVLVFSGCTTGSRSNLRPADTLPKGKFEVSAAVPVNGRNGINYGLVRLDYGVLDRLELNGKLEYGATLIGARWGLLSTNENGFALALGLSLGYGLDLSATPRSGYLYPDAAVWVPNVTIGKKFNSFEPYFAYQAFMNYGAKYLSGVYRLGTRIDLTPLQQPNPATKFLLVLELGVSQNLKDIGGFSYLPEGTVGATVLF